MLAGAASPADRQDAVSALFGAEVRVDPGLSGLPRCPREGAVAGALGKTSGEVSAADVEEYVNEAAKESIAEQLNAKPRSSK